MASGKISENITLSKNTCYTVFNYGISVTHKIICLPTLDTAGLLLPTIFLAVTVTVTLSLVN